MTQEMPERIYAGLYHKNGDKNPTDGWNIHQHGTEYVRADLVEPYKQALEKAREALEHYKRIDDAAASMMSGLRGNVEDQNGVAYKAISAIDALGVGK